MGRVGSLGWTRSSEAANPLSGKQKALGLVRSTATKTNPQQQTQRTGPSTRNPWQQRTGLESSKAACVSGWGFTMQPRLPLITQYIPSWF